MAIIPATLCGSALQYYSAYDTELPWYEHIQNAFTENGQQHCLYVNPDASEVSLMKCLQLLVSGARLAIHWLYGLMRLGITYSRWLLKGFISVRIANACSESGTICSRFIFIRSAGVRHSLASRSISCQRVSAAPYTPTGRGG